MTTEPHVPSEAEARFAYVDGLMDYGKPIAGQRDQLRTDEAVERVADWLCMDDHGYTLAGHGEWCQDSACDLVESYRGSARDLIAALIGEEP